MSPYADGRTAVLLFACLLVVFGLSFCSCASGPVRSVRLEQGLDVRTAKESGCWYSLPESGQAEVTLMTWQTCELVIKEEQRK